MPFEADASGGAAVPGAVLDGDELWRLRLATAGLDEDRLLTLLAADTTDRDTAAAVDLLCRGVSAPDATRRPFLAATGELLVRLREELAARVCELSAGSANFAARIRDPDLLVSAMVEEGIAGTVDTMLHRSMVSELARERAANSLAGETSAERFDSFVKNFADPDRRRSFYGRYPLLAQRIVVVTGRWRTAAEELLTRLATDLPHMSELGAPPDIGPVVAVRTGLGDLHRGARSVARIEFESGWKVVYKPRPSAVDAHFQDLVAWIGHRVPGLRLRIVRCLDRGAYGWMEFVESRPCADTRELRTFYRRQGALLALLYILHANDISAENLIAAGDQPVLVDLETLLQPRIDALRHAGRTPAETAAADLVTGSVIHAGLLPSGQSGWAELSGMSITDGPATSSVRIAHVEGGGTDEMRIRLRQAELPRARNQPNRVPGTVRLRDYTEEVVTGFREVYDVLHRRRAELIAPGGPLTAFRGDEVRVLLRDTSTYGMILGMSFHPRLLRDRWDQERHLDLLWREIATKPGLAAATEGERHALWHCDIPVFSARVEEAAVVDDRGEVVLREGVTSGWRTATDILDRLGPDDLARQLWLIRACLLTNGVRWDQPVVLARDSHTPAATPADDGSLLALASSVADRLAELAVEDSDGAVWLGVHTTAGTNWEVGEVGPDLYSGGLGIALFLAHYAEVSGETEHRARARRAVATALRQIDRGHLARGGGELGLLGLGGAVYALSELGTLWQDDGLLSAAVHLAQSMPRLIDEDEEFAVMDGSAGALLGLAALARSGRGGAIRDIARRAADRLVCTQGDTASGAAWLPRRMRELGIVRRPLAGYGHGASGVASALACAAEILGDATYLDAALRAVRYERELFDVDRNNWRDIRELTDAEGFALERRGDWTATEGNSIAWCHGAAGIGLARLHLLRHIDAAQLRADLDTAVETTLHGGFGNGHSLCHGDFGSLELAATVAAERSDDALWRRLRRHAATVAGDIARRGPRCGLYRDLEVPGLYTGLAGIGFGALRVSALPGGPGPLIGSAH